MPTFEGASTQQPQGYFNALNFQPTIPSNLAAPVPEYDNTREMSLYHGGMNPYLLWPLSPPVEWQGMNDIDERQDYGMHSTPNM